MVSKIVEKLNQVNKFPKTIIQYGCLISITMCIVGVVIGEYNSFFSQQIKLYALASTLVYTATILFTQTVIGGLIMDFFGNLNKDDE